MTSLCEKRNRLRNPERAATPDADLLFGRSRAGTCQFMHGDAPGIGREPDWCGKPVKPRSPYCPNHHKLCYADFHLPKRTGKGFRFSGSRQPGSS